MALSPRLARRALVVIILVTSFWWVQRGPAANKDAPSAPTAATTPSGPSVGPLGANAQLLAAVRQQISHAQLFAVGRVERLLPDDNDGSRHQKFLIRAAPDLTVLVVYNLDLAKRVPVTVGDSVTIRGEYIWNDKGGLIHWTHRDPAQSHEPGWVDLRGTRYQ